MDKSKIAYLSIIASLLIHVAVLGTMYWVSVSGEKDDLYASGPPLQLDFIELIEETELADGQSEEDITNVVANASDERVSERISNRSKERIAEDVYKNLKELEQQLKDELAAQHQDEPGYDGEIPEYEDLKDYSDAGKSTEGSVSATFSLDPRFTLKQPLPTYKCKSGGTVTVNITVDQKGVVEATDLNPPKTTTSNSCLIEEALSYAKKWKFDPSFSHPKKQTGWIEFRFQSQ